MQIRILKIATFFFIVLVVFVAGCKSSTIPSTSLPVDSISEQTTGTTGTEEDMYMVSHSEYWSNEEGQIITRLLNYQGQPLLASCYADIFYPNKTYFKQNESMTATFDSYYFSFITPSKEGVYEYKSTCYYGSKSRSVMNSFHLSPALNFINISHDDLSQKLFNLTDLSNAHFGNITYNLTQIKEDTDYIRSNLATNQSIGDIMTQLSSISAFCDDANTSSSLLCQWVDETRVRLLNMNMTMDSYLVAINQTTSSTESNIIQLNQTLSGMGVFTPNDREMLEKVYNCTVLGMGCYMTPDAVWSYNGRYIQGEVN